MHLYVVLFVVLFLSSCVTNNGDIGNLYGSWVLDAVDIDGVEQTSWKDDGSFTTWNFQNNIILVRRATAIHDANYVVGTWVRDDNTLTVDFNHKDDETPAGTGLYEAPIWIYFEHGVTTLTYLKDESKKMVLATTLSDGRRITYTLHKSI